MDDKKVTSLDEHRAKLQKRDEANNKETDSIVNVNVPAEVQKELDACVPHEDLEAVLRVFSVLRTIGDKVSIEFDQSDIYITTHHEEEDRLDAGIDWPEQVIKKSSTYQTSTINFDYVEEEWTDFDNFIYNVSFSLRRCIESLTFWAAGEKKDNS